MIRSAGLAALALATLACSHPGPPTPTLPPPDDVPPIPRYIATVATDDFARGDTLERAEADADLIERAFTARLDFEARPDLRLRNDDTTSDAIRALIGPNGPIDELPDDAMLVLYVALHGQAGACNADERCGRLWTRDAEAEHQALPVETFLAALAEHGPAHVIVLLDTCHGGLALRTELKPLDYAQLVGHRPGRRRSRKVLTAAGPLQRADDGDATRPGRFADTLLDALDGDADLMADGRLVFTELALYMQAEVRRRSGGGQEPEFGGFRDDGRGAPVLGGLRLPLVEESATAALLFEARRSIDREEYRAARRHLARLMQARRHRALAARRRLHDALRLAETGRGDEAVALLGEQATQQQAALGADHPAVAVTRQLRAELGRRGELPAEQVARLEKEATTASRAVSRAAQSPSGRAMAADALGGVALATGAPELSADLTAEAREASADEAALAGALAANEAVSAAAAGDADRAEAARVEARAAGVEVERPAVAMADGGDDLEATAFRPALVPIAPGAFTMGSPEGEAGRDDDERAHRVKLTRGFVMAESEVTQAQYAALMGKNPAYFKGEAEDGQRPVENVNWFDAVRYCNALSKAEGRAPAYVIEGDEVTWDRTAGGYRLPTEAEWEYAARAGAATATYAGDLDIRGTNNAPTLDEIAWYAGNSGSAHPKALDSSGWSEKQHPHEKASTHPVKGKRPNAWGLYDMLGNVWEWTWDRYAAEDPEGPTGAPLADPAGPADGADRVFRGGSFRAGARGVRSAYRYWRSPGYRVHWLGFRPVRAPRAP